MRNNFPPDTEQCTVCYERTEDPHYPHDHGCDHSDFCICDTPPVCPPCCWECRETER